MVWHSYMLNPRNYFEDCLRYNTMDFWATGMPWTAVDAAIDNATFEYNCNNEARQSFEAKTGFPWNSLDGPSTVRIPCPRCNTEVQAPLTTCTTTIYWAMSDPGNAGLGYADKLFHAPCTRCNLNIDHSLLRMLKFRRDLQSVLRDDLPFPGTILSIERGIYAFLNELILLCGC